MSMGTLMVLESAQMRRRRDSRGRYMEGEEAPEMRMEYGREAPMRARRSEMAMGRYSMEEPDMRRSDNYGRGNPDMRMPGVYPAETRRRNREDPMEDAEMRGEGHFRWDNLHEPIYRGMEDTERARRMEGGNITDMRDYGRRYSPQSHMDTGMQSHRQMTQQRQIGFQQREEDGEHLTREQAEKWVAGMEAADGTKGGRWKLDEIKRYASNFGVMGEEKIVEFFAVINAMYTDYCKVAKKFGVDKVDFYAELAKAFIGDKDANPGKVMTYYECIAKKDDE